MDSSHQTSTETARIHLQSLPLSPFLWKSGSSAHSPNAPPQARQAAGHASYANLPSAPGVSQRTPVAAAIQLQSFAASSAAPPALCQFSSSVPQRSGRPQVRHAGPQDWNAYVPSTPGCAQRLPEKSATHWQSLNSAPDACVHVVESPPAGQALSTHASHVSRQPSKAQRPSSPLTTHLFSANAPTHSQPLSALVHVTSSSQAGRRCGTPGVGWGTGSAVGRWDGCLLDGCDVGGYVGLETASSWGRAVGRYDGL
mmetsp:Transcript_19783/g.58657  ORF Transcript_19783/g.58657 Transcript_19783/m.58657 type:complete len:255 (-) Transcript_19783:1536-2300(-)